MSFGFTSLSRVLAGLRATPHNTRETIRSNTTLDDNTSAAAAFPPHADSDIQQHKKRQRQPLLSSSSHRDPLSDHVDCGAGGHGKIPSTTINKQPLPPRRHSISSYHVVPRTCAILWQRSINALMSSRSVDSPFPRFLEVDAAQWTEHAAATFHRCSAQHKQWLCSSDTHRFLACFGAPNAVDMWFVYLYSMSECTEPVGLLLVCCLLQRLSEVFDASMSLQFHGVCSGGDPAEGRNTTTTTRSTTTPFHQPFRLFAGHQLRLVLSLFILSQKVHGDYNFTLKYFHSLLPECLRNGIFPLGSFSIAEMAFVEQWVLYALRFNVGVGARRCQSLMEKYLSFDEVTTLISALDRESCSEHLLSVIQLKKK